MATQTLLTLSDLNALLDKHNASRVYCSEEDFVLGLSDLTGELMRWAINQVGSAGLGVDETVQSVKTAQMWVRQIQSGMSKSFSFGCMLKDLHGLAGMRPLGVNVRGLYSKLNVMDNSLIKLEKGKMLYGFLCYYMRPVLINTLQLHIL